MDMKDARFSRMNAYWVLFKVQACIWIVVPSMFILAINEAHFGDTVGILDISSIILLIL